MTGSDGHTMIHDLSNQMVPDWLTQRAFTTPSRLAVRCGDTNLSFAELDERANEVARKLRATGVQVGDRVAMLMENTESVPILVHALPRIGAILVPLNIRLKIDELVWQIQDCDPALLVTDHAQRERGVLVASKTGISIRMVGESRDGVRGLEQELPSKQPLSDIMNLEEIHSIVYTSGTTGRPKGAMLTYGTHFWSAIGSALNMGTMATDRWLAVLPLFHVGGLSILFRSVIYGIPVIIHRSFDPAEINRSIHADQITIISVVATMLQRMLDAARNEPYPEWLRCVLLGGGPAPRPLLEACAERNIPVTQTYGLTETGSQVATLAPEEALTQLGSAGKPLYPNQIRINDGESICAPETPGEIQVRGPIVTTGYWQRPDATAEKLRGGWLATGDIGYVNTDGYLYVLDRRDDLIISGGENVYPAEVEATLLSHPDIMEAGVTSRRDEHWGQRAVAVVRLHDQSTFNQSDIITFCRDRLASYKVPVDVVLTNSPLPRNAGGKLLRRMLQAVICESI